MLDKFYTKGRGKQMAVLKKMNIFFVVAVMVMGILSFGGNAFAIDDRPKIEEPPTTEEPTTVDLPESTESTSGITVESGETETSAKTDAYTSSSADGPDSVICDSDGYCGLVYYRTQYYYTDRWSTSGSYYAFGYWNGYNSPTIFKIAKSVWSGYTPGTVMYPEGGYHCGCEYWKIYVKQTKVGSGSWNTYKAGFSSYTDYLKPGN